MEHADTLTVALGERSYPIHFGRDLRAFLRAHVEQARALGRRLAVVTDRNAEQALSWLMLDALGGLPRHAVPPGEASKSLEHFGRICEFLARERIDRGGLLLAVGGGVVGDLAGFAAAAFLRGIEYWQAPTTLLAMVDSAVGGKTGINLEAGKNLVGAFHQPRAVYCDMRCLNSLAPREFSAGMAEVIKYGALADAGLFAELERAPVGGSGDPRLPGIVRTCCAIKAGIVREDERETAASGGRALLNLGHTFAHAIEAVAGYGAYLHGEAVGVGLVAASRLSERLGLLDSVTTGRLEAVVAAHQLPTRLREPLRTTSLIDAMQRDKKVIRGHLKFVVLERIGCAATRPGVPREVVEEIWSELGAN